MRWPALALTLAWSVAIVSLSQPTDAVLLTCPDAAAVEKCYLQYDRNDSKDLELDEFSNMFGHIGWWRRRVLSDEDKYAVKCDVNGDGKITPSEMQSHLCMSTCEEQALFYGGLCE